jgi:CHAD domain-containing protein
VVETLDALVERYREQLPPQAFAGLRAALTAEAQTALERMRSNPASLDAVIAELAAARERITTWPVDGAAGDEPLVAGFRRIYGRGRRASRKTQDHPDDETLHELRKRAKDLRHAAQIMRPARPKGMKKVARRAHTLADALGDHHDLGVLRDAAAERGHTLRPGEFLLLRAVVREWQGELRDEALKLGRRVYSKKRPRVAARS